MMRSRLLTPLLLVLGVSVGIVGCASERRVTFATMPLVAHRVPGPESDAAPSAARVRARAVATAQRMLGTPYRYGGQTPAGFDCSGLVAYSYAHAGWAGLPHSARELHAYARPVPLDELLPGDLLFFAFGGARVSHVAIYIGGRSFVHAPKSGGRVERVDFDHPYWRHQIRLAGRLPEPAD